MSVTYPPVRGWQVAERWLEFGPIPLLMGIVNVTPDSFSDGGKYADAGPAIEHGLRLASEGAAILDIGGESTRPYSEPVTEAEELQRILPVVRELSRQCRVPISIDTSKPRVAAAAIAAGATIINDVTGLESAEMQAVARESGAGVCAMHMQGTPQTMQDHPTYTDVVAEIHHYLEQRREQLLQAGIALEKICLDPGIGFGKTHEHNLTLMQHCGRFLDLGCPILVGHSRKGFIGKVLGDKERDRTWGTIGAACALAAQGMHIIRVHAVRETWDALQLFHACRELNKA
jgi:dihydropteroate synthase